MTGKKQIPEFLTVTMTHDGSNEVVDIPTSEMNELSKKSFFPPEEYDHGTGQ